MTIDFKTALHAACMAAMLTGVSGLTYAADEEETDSYQLSQMRNLSKSAQPDLGAPEAAGLMAETDLQELAKAAAAMEEIDNIAPAVSKPALPDLKPTL